MITLTMPAWLPPAWLAVGCLLGMVTYRRDKDWPIAVSIVLCWPVLMLVFVLSKRFPR